MRKKLARKVSTEAMCWSVALLLPIEANIEGMRDILYFTLRTRALSALCIHIRKS